MQAAIETYTRETIDYELSVYRKRYPDFETRWAALTLEQIETWKAGFAATAAEIADAIATRSEKLLSRICSGMLHPDNPRSRKLFTGVTGIPLPPTVSGTDAALAADPVWGPALADYRRKADREAAERRNAESARLEDLRQRFASGERVTGDELIDVARAAGIDVHPRTAGTLRRRVVEIGGGSARVRGGACPDGVWALYHATLAAVS